MTSLTRLRPELAELKSKLDDFVEECIRSEEEFEEHLRRRHGKDRWTAEAIPPCLHRLSQRAKSSGLWNLFLPPHLISKIPKDMVSPDLLPRKALSYREYGILCESLGRSPTLAPMATNTNAPDTGNMECLLEFGTLSQKRKYLGPLLRGEIRSTFLMTEPKVASSDPTNLSTTLKKQIEKDGTVKYVLNGTKWWSTGALDPRCAVALVVARMETSAKGKHNAHTIVLVPLPHPGVIVQRPLSLFGYDDAPFGHAEVLLKDVELTAENVLLGEGMGFRIAQARLGPGRIHHCMRAIGMAQRAYEMMLERSIGRVVFGKHLYEHGSTQESIAESFSDLEAARLLTLSCADDMDRIGAKNARNKIASIKVAVPNLAHRVVDRAIQIFGGAGVSDDLVLGRFLVGLRSLRIADGPDEVHRRTIARIEIQKMKQMHKIDKRSRL